jgi:drug/metabolite transporter (DMT)-like permease
MLTYRAALALMSLSMLCVAGSQILVKWRFGAMGLDRNNERTWFDLAALFVTDGGLWVAGLLVVAGAATWYAALTKLPLTLMLPVGGIISPLVAIGAHLLLGERLTPSQLVAILIISAGVALLASLQ